MSDNTIVTPTAAHAEALRAHAAAEEAHRAARTALDAAVAEKRTLLDAVSEGADVSTATLRQREDDIRNREADLILATAVLEGCTRRLHRAEVPVLQEQAENLDAAVQQAVHRFIDASQTADEARDAAQAEVNNAADAHRALVAAMADSRVHNEQVGEKAKTNTLLQSLHVSLWPKSKKIVATHDIPSVKVGYLSNGFDGNVQFQHDLGQRARSLYSTIIAVPKVAG